MKKIIAIFICASMILTGFTTFAQQTTGQTVKHKMIFNDVNESTEEGKSIYKLVDAGIVNGNGDGTFTPQNGITRAEFCKMVNLVYGYREMANSQFVDVKSSDWFYEQVLIAKKAGYIQGYDDGTFKGENNITREEFCTIISRINKLEAKGTMPTISDEISDWAKGYVNQVLTNGVKFSDRTENLMYLETNNTFRATVPIKRGEVAVVLARCYDVVNKAATFTQVTPAVKDVPVTTNPVTPSVGGNSGGGNSGGGNSGGGNSGGGPTGPSTYTITFESNGGSSVSTQTITAGSKVTKPSDPIKSGYVFSGWYTDASLTQPYDFTKVVSNSSFKLYAKWDKSAVPTFVVTFDSKGGSTIAPISVNKDTAATKPANPTYSGYIFEGWYKDSALTQSYDFSAKVTQNITLYAKWTKNESVDTTTKYTVTFNSNGGSAVSNTTVNKNDTVPQPTNPTKSGCLFGGWYSDSSLTEEYDFNSPVTANITLYAKWRQQFTVTFNTNGGSSVAAQKVYYGDCVEEPDEPVKVNYTFEGWYKDSGFNDEYDFGDEVKSSFTLYAKWKKIPQEVKVTFNSMGGSSVEAQYVLEGDTASEPEQPERNGYNFAGWYSDSACNNAYDFSSPVTKAITIYAKWTQVKVYSVMFSWGLADYPQLTLAMDNVAKPASQRVIENECVEYPDEPYMDYHQFVGWYVDEYYFIEYDFDEPVTDNITLYGKWEAIPEEMESVNSEVAIELAKAKTQLETNIGNFGKPGDIQFELIANVIGVLEVVIGKKDKYVFDKVNIYAEDPDVMIESYDMFKNSLDDVGKRSFVSNISSLDEESYKFLLDFFDINPDDYI